MTIVVDVVVLVVVVVVVEVKVLPCVFAIAVEGFCKVRF